jgi:hypothetical protein
MRRVPIILFAVATLWWTTTGHTASAQSPAAERAELAAWLDSLPTDRPTVIRSTDARGERMARFLRENAGLTDRRMLGTEKLLARKAAIGAAADDACEAFTRERQVTNMVIDVAAYPGDGNVKPQYSATALSASSDPQNIGITRMVINVYDGDYQPITTANGVRNLSERLATVSAKPADGPPLDPVKPVNGVGTFVYYLADGTPCEVIAPKQTLLATPQKIGVTAPLRHAGSQLDYIVVCLNRANPEPGFPNPCDYGPYDNQGVFPPFVKLPTGGRIEYFADIDADANKKPIGASARLTLANVASGNTCDVGEAGPQIVDNWTATGNVLTWNLNPATFKQVCYQSGSGLVFALTIVVAVKSPTGLLSTIAYITNGPASGPPKREAANTHIIPKLQVQWGCLAEDTPVTLADGSTKPIRAITADDVVQGADGRPWEIYERSVGSDGLLIHVETDDGHAADLTDQHPVAVSYRDLDDVVMVRAGDLRPGMAIRTIAGASTIRAVAEKRGLVPVYNFSVRPLDQGAGVPQGASLFYAGGILVGDNRMQGQPSAPPPLSREEVRRRLPPELLEDADLSTL